MSIAFACRCGQRDTVPDHAAGLKIRCQRCGEPACVPDVFQARPDTTNSGSWIMLVNQAKGAPRAPHAPGGASGQGGRSPRPKR
jgi:hypothetical protein